MLGDKLPLGIAPGTSGALVGNRVTTNVAGAAVSLPAAGDYYLITVGAALICEVLDDSGAWNTLYPVGQGGLISTEGTSLRVRNTGGVQQSYALLKLG